MGQPVTLRLNLPLALEQRLREESSRRGLALDVVAVRLLDQSLASADRSAEAIAIVQSWMDSDDAEDQRETGEFLIRSLDVDRPGERPFFPSELKGVSW